MSKKKLRKEGAAQQPGLAQASKEIAALHQLTTKQLVIKAKEEFGQDLKADNGRTWLLKKVGYMIQEKLMGASENVKAEAESLDTEERKTELKQEDAKVALLKAAKHKPAKEKEGKETLPRNEVGSVKGSKRDILYQMMKKGCTMGDFKAAGGGMSSIKWFMANKGLNIAVKDDKIRMEKA